MLLLVVVLLASVGGGMFAWRRIRDLETRNAVLLQATGQMEQLEQENRELQRLKVATAELEQLRKANQELPRLRGQYQEFQRLKEEYALLQRENERLKAVGPAAGTRPAVVGPPNPSPAPLAISPPEVWIGVALRPSAEGQSGAIVQSVVPNGPAANSGLAVGDAITAVDGRAVATPQELRSEIGTKRPGQHVVVDVLRDGQTFLVGITAAAFPK
jgi:membrane-associated protease RseP (regulator of RpoE activity)